ncbi:MAG: hypothetical protein AAFY88_10015 [Acidobacteriota bacterium]
MSETAHRGQPSKARPTSPPAASRVLPSKDDDEQKSQLKASGAVEAKSTPAQTAEAIAPAAEPERKEGSSDAAPTVMSLLTASSAPTTTALAPPTTAPISTYGQVQPSCNSLSMFSPFPPGQKAFTIGKLYYDFGSEARRDYFIAQMRSHYESAPLLPGENRKPFNQGMVYDPQMMIKYLFDYWPYEDLPEDPEHLTDPRDVQGKKVRRQNNLDAANALIWTVFIDQDPVYALVPEDQYAVVSFTRLAKFLYEQEISKCPGTYRVAMSGSINGQITLFNGTVVPKLNLVTRGMFNWNLDALIDAIVPPPPADPEAEDPYKGIRGALREDLTDFLLRVYDALRNLGVTSADRAKNFAATNLYQVRDAFLKAYGLDKKPSPDVDPETLKNRRRLDRITTGTSPICRRNSDCWDIGLTFFNPNQLFQEARHVYEYTIDVSDVIPVQVGAARYYPIYGGPQG